MIRLSIRRMRPGEERAVCDLVERSFSRFVAPDFPPEGVREFRRFADPVAMAARREAGEVVLVAEQDGRLLGMLELRGAGHIALLFAETPGQGVGRALYREAVQVCRHRSDATGEIRTHASRYAVPIYTRLGFESEGPEKTENGITYLPMVARHDRAG
jgi:GNAT superfamily N-acetyltransferase